MYLKKHVFLVFFSLFIFDNNNFIISSEKKNNNLLQSIKDIIVNKYFYIPGLLLLGGGISYCLQKINFNIQKNNFQKQKPSQKLQNPLLLLKCRHGLNYFAGYSEVKEKLLYCADEIINNKYGMRNQSPLNRTYFIYGERQCGKTLLPQLLAGELHCMLGYIDVNLINQYKDNFKEIIDKIFNYLELHFTGIVNIDNIEKINKDAYFYLFSKIIKINTTNQSVMVIISSSDPQFTLHEKFAEDSFITFLSLKKPNLEDRKEILEFVLKKFNTNGFIDIKKIASMTKGYSTYEIINLIYFADYLTIENKKNGIEEKDIIQSIINLHVNKHLLKEHIQEMYPYNNNLIKTFKPAEKTGVTLDDVAGLDFIKSQINHIIQYLKDPKKYDERGIKIPRGVLFSGQSGCGKTLLARAIAEVGNATFFAVNGSDFISSYIASGTMNIDELFKTAREYAPCIIFIDEIDSIAVNRNSFHGGGDSTKEYTQAVNKLLEELDGFNKDNLPVILIGATNRKESLDPAILRPGRIDLILDFDLPSLSDREKILQLYFNKKNYNEKTISIDYLAKKTIGFSAAKIEHLVNLSALKALENNHEIIEFSDCMEAYEESTMGHALQKNYSFDDLWATAIHEAGHLICVMKSPDNLYTYDFISIVPRSGGSLGVTYYIPKNEEISCFSKNNLFTKIIVSLGGMAAEQFFLQVTGSGVSDDLEKATYIAKQMVFKLGMNDSLVVLEEDSKEGLEKVDKVLKEAKEAADKIISENEKEILIIANALMERKTLTREEIDELLKKN